MLLAEFRTGQVLWSFLWFFLFVMWLILFIHVLGDVFRSRDMSGAAKALWVLALIVLPYLGVLLYLIARGDKMRDNAVARASEQEAAVQDYIKGVVGTSTPAQELERLEGLHQRGVISDEEYASLKARALG